MFYKIPNVTKLSIVVKLITWVSLIYDFWSLHSSGLPVFFYVTLHSLLATRPMEVKEIRATQSLKPLKYILSGCKTE